LGWPRWVFYVRKLNLRSRRDLAAVEAIQSIFRGSFPISWRIIIGLPVHCPAERVANDATTRAAADDIALTFESLGYLVFRRIVPLRVTDELVGGIVTGAWQPLRPWLDDCRKSMPAPRLFEWFNWLADRMEEHREV